MKAEEIALHFWDETKKTALAVWLVNLFLPAPALEQSLGFLFIVAVAGGIRLAWKLRKESQLKSDA